MPRTYSQDNPMGVDLGALDEARIYADNTEPIYRNKMAWKDNVRRKMERGVYERKLMEPAIEKYFVKNVQKSYEKEHGGLPMNKATKQALAKRFTRSIEYEAREEFDREKVFKKRKVLKGPMFAAEGYSGVVSQPTMFIAGEAGKERVNITKYRGDYKPYKRNGGNYGLGDFKLHGLTPRINPKAFNLGIKGIGSISKKQKSMFDIYKVFKI